MHGQRSLLQFTVDNVLPNGYQKTHSVYLVNVLTDNESLITNHSNIVLDNRLTCVISVIKIWCQVALSFMIESSK